MGSLQLVTKPLCQSLKHSKCNTPVAVQKRKKIVVRQHEEFAILGGNAGGGPWQSIYQSHFAKALTRSELCDLAAGYANTDLTVSNEKKRITRIALFEQYEATLRPSPGQPCSCPAHSERSKLPSRQRRRRPDHRCASRHRSVA